MSVEEMRELTSRLYVELKPLYEQLHCWTRYELAERYGEPVPRLIPAHWLGNRWGQQWPGLVEAANFDPYFEDKKPEWLVEQAERFYVSLGWRDRNTSRRAVLAERFPGTWPRIPTSACCIPMTAGSFRKSHAPTSSLPRQTRE